MDNSNSNRPQKKKHISDYTENELITELGLYDTFVIDTQKIYTRFGPGNERTRNILYDEVSPDVKKLHEILFSSATIELPCPYCQKNQPFRSVGWIDVKSTIKMQAESKSKNIMPMYIPYTDLSINCEEDEEEKPCLMERIEYQFGKDRFDAHRKSCFDDTERRKTYDINPKAYKNRLAEKCIYGLLQNASDIRKDYECTMNPNHRYSIGFVLEWDMPDNSNKEEKNDKRRETDKNAKTIAEDKTEYVLDEDSRYCIIARKTMQYPSMFDMQLFDSKKYQKVLGKNYRDYNRALLIASHGIGIGSFAYLRRIYESIVEEIHQECTEEEGWEEEIYKKSHFDERIKILEKRGKTIIPPELTSVKSQIYDILSKGVHESSEEECLDLFPYLKTTIDILLDAKLAKREHDKKINEIIKKVQHADAR